MSQPSFRDDRGTGLVEYALVALLIAVGGLLAVSFVGDETGQQFDEAATALSSDPDEADEELTPEEKWEKAQADYDKALADAKANQAAALGEANAAYQAAVDANKSLPKADRSAANQAAKETRDSTKTAVNAEYNAQVKSAKAAKAAAKTEYNATK